MIKFIPDFIEKVYSGGFINISIDQITTPEIIVETGNINRLMLKKDF